MVTSLLAMLASEGLLALDLQALSRGRIGSGATERRAGAVAVLPLAGPLMARGRETWFGSVPGMDKTRAALASAKANPEISAVVLDVDSPGGTVAGTAETAAAVRDLAAVKPVIAVANGMAASAAYWIASAATQLVIAPGGEVGSIGVLSGHQDMSKMYERIGVQTTLITSSPYKAERSPFGPLSDEARAAIQASVDRSDAEFVAAVALGRRTSVETVKAKFGQGRMVDAADAVRAGMADRVATLDTIVAELLAGERPSPPRRRASAFHAFTFA